MSSRIHAPPVGLRQKVNSAMSATNSTSTVINVPGSEQPARKAVDIKIACFDISGFSPTVQFLLLTAAVFFFYLIYGYMQVNLNIWDKYLK